MRFTSLRFINGCAGLALLAALTAKQHTFASFLSRDTTFDLITSIWRIKHPDVPTTLGVAAAAVGSDGSDDEGEEQATPSGGRRKRSLRRRNKGPRSGATVASGLTESPELERRSIGGSSGVGAESAFRAHPPTTCACSKNGEHAKDVCMDATFPCTPEKTYNLIYTSGLLRNFLVQDQQLLGAAAASALARPG